MSSPKKIGTTLGVLSSLFLLSLAVFAFTGPSASAPDGNVFAPLDTSSTTQYKEGQLTTEGIFEAPSVLLNPDEKGRPICSSANRGEIWREFDEGGTVNLLTSNQATVEENASSGFSSTGGLRSQSDEQVLQGNYSLKFTPSGGGGTEHVYMDISIQPNTDYSTQIPIWSPDGHNVSVAADERGDGNYLKTLSSSVLIEGNNGWQIANHSGTTSSETDTLRIIMRRTGNTDTTPWYYDRGQVEQKPHSTPFVDGTREGWGDSFFLCGLDSAGSYIWHRLTNNTFDHIYGGFNNTLDLEDRLNNTTISPSGTPVATIRQGEGFTGDAVAVEEGTTNIAPSPTQVGLSTGWTNYLNEREYNSVIAPDGTLSGTKMIATSSGQVRTEFSISSPADDTYYTFSVYAKRGSNPYAALYTYFNPHPSPGIIANLDTGEIVFSQNTTSHSISETVDGWYRISMTVLVRPDQTHRLFKVNLTSSSSSVTSGISGDYVYYWGAQLEQKPFLTSFVDGTRAAGGLVYENPPIYEIEEFTMGGWYLYNVPHTENTLERYNNALLSCGGGDVFYIRRYTTYYGNAGRLRLRYFDDLSLWIGDSNEFINNTWYHVTITFNKGTFRMYINGEIRGSGSILTSTIPDLGACNVGGGVSWDRILNGLIDDFIILPYALTRDEISELYDFYTR